MDESLGQASGDNLSHLSLEPLWQQSPLSQNGDRCTIMVTQACAGMCFARARMCRQVRKHVHCTCATRITYKHVHACAPPANPSVCANIPLADSRDLLLKFHPDNLTCLEGMIKSDTNTNQQTQFYSCWIFPLSAFEIRINLRHIRHFSPISGL